MRVHNRLFARAILDPNDTYPVIFKFDRLSLLLLDGETFSTAAFFSGVGIIEMESRSQALRNEIDLGTVEEAQAVVRHDDFHSIIFEHDIVRADAFGHLDYVSPA